MVSLMDMNKMPESQMNLDNVWDYRIVFCIVVCFSRYTDPMERKSQSHYANKCIRRFW